MSDKTTITVSKETLQDFNDAKPFNSLSADEFLSRMLKVYDNATKSVETRFEQRWEEDENGCWIWTALTGGDGYGQLYIDGKCKRAHRVAYRLHNGDIPNGKFVLHKCDVPECVNPDHLYAGTQSDNQRDRWERTGWKSDDDPDETGVPLIQLSSEENPNAKLTQEEADEIRDRYANEDVIQRKLADEYGVSATTVSEIVNGKKY